MFDPACKDGDVSKDKYQAKRRVCCDPCSTASDLSGPLIVIPYINEAWYYILKYAHGSSQYSPLHSHYPLHPSNFAFRRCILSMVQSVLRYLVVDITSFGNVESPR